MMKQVFFALLALLALFAVANATRQDESLDSLLLTDSLEPVADPVPRLLAEMAGDAAKPGSYGIPTTQIPAKAGAAGAVASAGLAGLAAAAAVLLAAL